MVLNNFSNFQSNGYFRFKNLECSKTLQQFLKAIICMVLTQNFQIDLTVFLKFKRTKTVQEIIKEK